ncbi:MAG: HAMP domain-containing histidine kinase [Dysgonamonadaceae bacterium]|jgi:signal transduction histidine kinase|nr:HAMP domain-containing histidine kinase [Dysgonamonadaceae bacterium]
MANEYQSGKTFRYLFILTAVVIVIVSVWVTNALVDELKEEERKKMEIWAESVALMSSQTLLEDPNNAGAFDNYTAHLLKIIEDNTTIPTVHTDENGHFLYSSNIRFSSKEDSLSVGKKIKAFGKKHDPITIQLDENTVQHIYYDDSTVLKQLQLFPFVQLTVVFSFIIISFLALNSTQKAEQNKVWVGLSKETAHQLGTPISSLMAWVEYLKTKDIDPGLLDEMDKDVQRLKTIAERFSKIGSNGEPEPMDLATAVANAVAYMGRRISSKVSISTQMPGEPVTLLMNESLFGWTLENLIKNAVDAMDGQGEIKIQAFSKGKKIILDVSDTGKGIPKSKFDTVFHPGYTTKKRGWGLGLSLVKRIIESYQKGKIYVYKSELGKGTTFRMEL